MTVRDDLLAAYALIRDEAQGWCVGRLRDYEGRHCLHGSTLMVRPDLALEIPLSDAAVELFGHDDYAVINDRYGHRAATMVLRHAILREEGAA